jgi:hypothetical protein
MTGWLGRIPGPIFAFHIIRPPDRLITNANVSVTLSGSVTSIQMFVITSWSGGIAIEKDEMGVDHFTVVRGL